MKKILNYNLFAVAALVLLSSCNNDYDTTYTSSVKAIATTDVLPAGLTIAEGTSTAVTITLDKPLNIKTDMKIEVLSGTGVFRDFTVTYGANEPLDIETSTDDGWGLIGYKITIPAYTTSFTFNINAVLDLLPEGTENLVLKLTPAGNGVALLAPGSELINLTIPNTTSNNFVVNMEWNGDHPDAHGTIVPTTFTGTDSKEHEMCVYDFDLEIYDDTFSATPYFDYDNCPATVTIDAADPDGDYIVVPSFWTIGSVAATNVNIPKSGDIIFPVKVTMAKPGVFTHTTDMTGKFTYKKKGAVQGNPDAYIPIAIITKTGNNYVLTDYDTAEVLGSGRYANLLNNIKNKMKNKR
jgi:hypothetical protein